MKAQRVINSLKYLWTLCVPCRGREYYAGQKLKNMPDALTAHTFKLYPNIEITLMAEQGRIAVERGIQTDRVIVSSAATLPGFTIKVQHLNGGDISELILETNSGNVISGDSITVYLLHHTQLLGLRIRVSRLGMTTEESYYWSFRYLTTKDCYFEFM